MNRFRNSFLSIAVLAFFFSAHAAFAASPKLNYLCTFTAEQDPGQALCSQEAGTVSFTLQLQTTKSRGRRVYTISQAVQYPQSQCCAANGCTGSSTFRVKLKEKAKNSITLTFDQRRYLMLIAPLSDTIDALYFSSNGELGYGACSGCVVPLLGSCTISN